MDIRLDGKTALITGGSRGLGRAMAIEFARSGGAVAIAARDPVALSEARDEIATAAPKARIAAIGCDISTSEGCEAAHAQAVKELGQIDILVNNAGTSRRGPFLEIDDAAWQADFDLKVFAAIRLTRLVMPGMKKQGWGRIINVLNIGAKAPAAQSAPTSVSRAAGLAITKALSQEGAEHGVLVNAMHVGLIDSDQWVRRHAADPNAGSYEQYIAAMAAERKIPLGRIGRAEEFANMACFLASDAASYITGVSINVDGGASPVV